MKMFLLLSEYVRLSVACAIAVEWMRSTQSKLPFLLSICINLVRQTASWFDWEGRDLLPGDKKTGYRMCPCGLLVHVPRPEVELKLLFFFFFLVFNILVSLGQIHGIASSQLKCSFLTSEPLVLCWSYPLSQRSEGHGNLGFPRQLLN